MSETKRLGERSGKSQIKSGAETPAAPKTIYELRPLFSRGQPSQRPAMSVTTARASPFAVVATRSCCLKRRKIREGRNTVVAVWNTSPMTIGTTRLRKGVSVRLPKTMFLSHAHASVQGNLSITLEKFATDLPPTLFFASLRCNYVHRVSCSNSLLNNSKHT